MNIQISGHQMDVSSPLREFTEKKLGNHLKPYSDHITNLHMTLHIDKKVRQHAKAQISVPGRTLVAEAESEDMYKTVDLIIDKLVRLLREHKSKLTDHHQNHHD